MNSKNRYLFLDGFRAIAILLILGRHVRDAFYLKDLFSHDTPVLTWIYIKTLKNFHLDLSSVYLTIQFAIHKIKGLYGVEMFLVISGFLITGILIKNGIQRISIRLFYLRRLLKIYPAYCLLIVVGVILFSVKTQPQEYGNIWTQFLYHFLFLQNYFPTNPFLAHTWTLVIIEQFYFVCPLIIAVVCYWSPSPKVRTNILIGICILVIAIGNFVRFYFQQTGQALITWPVVSPIFVQTTIFRFDAIAFGCLLALTESVWSRKAPDKRWGILYYVTALTIYYLLIFHSKWGYYTGEWYLYSFGYLAFGCLILAAYHGILFVSRFKFLQWIGRQSYGIFLWHYILLPIWGCWRDIIPLPILIIGYIISCVAIGALSTNTIERYFLNIREKVASKTTEGKMHAY